MFSFRGRISRLPYFIQGFLALPLIVGASALVLSFAFAPLFRNGNKGAFVFCVGLILIALAVVGWFTLALQTKRIRDMGWDPLIVLPGWFALQLIDAIFVHFRPEYGIGPQHNQTAMSAAVNLFLFAVLLFWPSADDEGLPPPLRIRKDSKPDYQPQATAQAMPRSTPPGKATFGRR